MCIRFKNEIRCRMKSKTLALPPHTLVVTSYAEFRALVQAYAAGVYENGCKDRSIFQGRLGNNIAWCERSSANTRTPQVTMTVHSLDAFPISRRLFHKCTCPRCPASAWWTSRDSSTRISWPRAFCPGGLRMFTASGIQRNDGLAGRGGSGNPGHSRRRGMATT